MKYTFEGKTYNIPDIEIETLMENLDLTEKEAIEVWLDDRLDREDEEQAKLEKKASEVKISKGAKTDVEKKERKPRTTKISDEKSHLFQSILTFLTENSEIGAENVSILTENKLIFIKIGEKTFKLDLIEQRRSK